MSLAHASVSVLRTCLVQAVRGADALMLRLLQRTEYALEQALFSDFSASRRDVLKAALHNLQQHRAHLITSYPQNLLEALVLSARQPFSFTAQSLDTSSASLASLASMGESADRQLKAEQRLLQMVAPQVELALADLDALMCGAQGLESADPECNPLQPENYIRALDQSLTTVQPVTEVAQCWRDFMGQQLGAILVAEYTRAATLLRRQGVHPAQYGVGASGNHSPQSLLTLRVLQEMASDLRWIEDSHFTIPQSLPDSMLADWSAPTALPATLTAMAPDVLMGLQTGWASYSGNALQLAVPPQKTTEAGFQQQLLSHQAQSGLLQVRMLQRMMTHMSSDARLLPAVQSVLKQLEPALIRLVEQDATFFDNRQHAARQLLDELTARSLWFVSESALGFKHFIGVAETAATRLAGLPQVDAPVFALALQFVREQWPPEAGQSAMSIMGAVSSQETTTQGLMTSALGLLDRPSVRALVQSTPPDTQSIAQTIRNLPSAQGVPEDILDFVTGPWAEVIAHAQQRRTDESERDPGGYLALVPSLLWSVSAQAAQNTARLVQLAPRLQRRLARGLRSVGRSDVEIAALAARIGGLQQHALDMGQIAESQALPGRASVQPEEIAAPLTAPSSQAQALPVLTEIAHTEGVETSQLAASDLPKPEPITSDPWALGTWVELRSERQHLRTQLTWMSPQQSLFLFTAEDGSTQSMTRRMRDKLMANGQLTRIDVRA